MEWTHLQGSLLRFDFRRQHTPKCLHTNLLRIVSKRAIRNPANRIAWDTAVIIFYCATATNLLVSRDSVL